MSLFTNWKKDFKEFFVIFLIIFVFRSCFINWYSIPSGSMFPTLKVGDHIVVNKMEYGFMLPFMHTRVASWNSPQKGDIVVFKDLEVNHFYDFLLPRNLIKRVVGVAGDVVTFRAGVLTINGTPVEEKLVDDREILNDLGKKYENSVTNHDLYLESGASKFPHHTLRLKADADSRTGYRTDLEYRTWVIPEGKLLVVGDNRDDSHDGRFFGLLDEKNVYGRAFVIAYSLLSEDEDILPSFRPDRWWKTLTN